MIYNIEGIECVVHRTFINEGSTILERLVEVLLTKVKEREEESQIAVEV